jgi:hypothetical protein
MVIAIEREAASARQLGAGGQKHYGSHIQAERVSLWIQSGGAAPLHVIDDL